LDVKLVYLGQIFQANLFDISENSKEVHVKVLAVNPPLLVS